MQGYFGEETVVIKENVKRVEGVYAMSDEVRVKIQMALKRHFVFSSLEGKHVDKVIEEMFACTAAISEKIF